MPKNRGARAEQGDSAVGHGSKKYRKIYFSTHLSTDSYITHPFFHHVRERLSPHHPHHFGRHAHRGFAGFGGRHGASGDPLGAGFDGLGRGRKLGAADLQLLLLALLAERPSHGYELIKALDERSKGYYSPSPGMVYPALTYLEEIGHASVESQGAKKRYQVSAEGLAHLDAQRSSVDALLEQLAWIGQRMDQVRQAMAGGQAPNDGLDLDPSHAPRGRRRHAEGLPELVAARHALRSALIEKAGASVDEQLRIAAILERATADIRTGTRTS